MKNRLLEIKDQALKEIDLIRDQRELEGFRIAYLGKKGALTRLMKKVGQLSPEERPEFGKLANRLKNDLTGYFEAAKKRLLAKKIAFASLLLVQNNSTEDSLH